MRHVVLIGISLAFGIGNSLPLFAVELSSPHFRSSESSLTPATTFYQASRGFRLSSSLEEASGKSSSRSFNVQSGVLIPEPAAAAPATPSPQGAGGLGIGPPARGFAVLPPTFVFRSPTFLSHQLVGGRYATGTTVLVNGSGDGLRILPGLTWQRDVPLVLGLNTILVRAQDAQRTFSQAVGGVIDRLLVGDVNQSRVVDDVDLSLFTRAWKTYTPYADFNEDGTINDVDLSLFVSQWGRSL